MALYQGTVFPCLNLMFYAAEETPCSFSDSAGLWPQAAAGMPFTTLEFQSKGDAFADLCEDLAAEQKARTVYDNLLRVIEDPDVRAPLKFLRAREIVHFQRFGEAIEMTKETLDAKNFYYFNPEFDKKMFHNPL